MASSRRAAIEARVEEALEQAALPKPLHEQASAVAMKAFAHYAAWPTWPIAELPYRAAVALGADEELATGLAAAAVMFYCASDVIDDAQDDELSAIPGWRWSWQHAVNTGNLFLFLSQATVLGLEAPEGTRRAWAAAFANAGIRLAAGQANDFEAAPDALLGEEAILAITADKAGAAWGTLAALAPIWAGREDVPAWAAFGEKLGTIYQLVSDIWPYVASGPHKDLATGKLTLPLLYARDMDAGIGELFEAGMPLEAERQEALRARVAATGAVIYAEMRVEVLKKEAQDLLSGLGSDAAQASLSPLLALPALASPLRPGV